ncbi:MAG: hypothetical protein WD267_08810 [Balneolales bacterium]
MKAILRLLFPAVLFLAACTVDGIDDESRTINETEQYIAGQIIAESLSDQSEGIMASLFDAFEIPTQEGFRKTELASSAKSPVNLGEIMEIIDFTYSYNQENGTHTTSYSRIHDEGVQRTMEAELKYIYFDNNGDFLEFPTYDLVSSVIYNATRSGSTSSPTRNTTFVRKDQFFIDGFSDDNITLTMDGEHLGEGTISGNTPGGINFDRHYTIKIEFLNIQITKSTIVGYTNLEQGLSGSLGYTVTMDHNGDLKEIKGTVQISGDGTALIKFKDLADILTFKLVDARQLDDDEFDDRIKIINDQNDFIILANNQRIQFNSETIFDNAGDFPTLEQAQTALNQGDRIIAIGIATRIGTTNTFIASEAGFWLENPEVDWTAYLNIEGQVKTVNLQRQTFNLDKGVKIHISEATVFSESGDIKSLEVMHEAIKDKKKVSVKGEGSQDSKNRKLILAHNLEVIYDEE